MGGQQCYSSSKPAKATKDKSTCTCSVSSNKSNQTNQQRSGRAGNNKFQTKCPHCGARPKPGPVIKPGVCSKSAKRSNKCNKKSFCAKKIGRSTSKSIKTKTCGGSRIQAKKRKCKCPNAPKIRKIVKQSPKKKQFTNAEAVCTCSGNAIFCNRSTGVTHCYNKKDEKPMSTSNSNQRCPCGINKHPNCASVVKKQRSNKKDESKCTCKK